MPIDYDITNPAPLMQSDVDLIRLMNPSQKELRGSFEIWPEWAKKDALLVAAYRRRFSTNDGPG